MLRAPVSIGKAAAKQDAKASVLGVGGGIWDNSEETNREEFGIKTSAVFGLSSRAREREIKQMRRRADAAAARRAQWAREQLGAAKSAASARAKFLLEGGSWHMEAISTEKFSVPHPSGSGAELITDARLKLVPGRRYGLVGE